VAAAPSLDPGADDALVDGWPFESAGDVGIAAMSPENAGTSAEPGLALGDEQASAVNDAPQTVVANHDVVRSSVLMAAAYHSIRLQV
jgi:hypothetical protein